MKKNTIKYSLLVASICLLTLSYGCDAFLDVDKFDKIDESIPLGSIKGINSLLATLYSNIPMEDFNYREAGFHRKGWDFGAPQIEQGTQWNPFYTDEAVQSHGSGIGMIAYNYWSGTVNQAQGITIPRNGFNTNRYVSIFLNNIEKAKSLGTINENQYNRLWSEAHFVRAYTYYALVKRYGGVPIIDWLQDDDYNESGIEALFVPRNTESETWRFVLAEIDKAIQYLPFPADFDKNEGHDPMVRASKWAAYALKSRVALHAASLAKYGGRVSFSGNAVTQKLVGLDPSEADYFYGECIAASKKLIDEGGYSLYMPNPASREEAAKNYQNLFMNFPSGSEIIFGRRYLDGVTRNYEGHDYDVRFTPSQTPTGFHKWGRFSPTIDLVDLYEDYTDNGTGASAIIKTRTDGVEDQYLTINNPTSAQITSIPFIKYDNMYEPFKDKDARLHGSIVVPGGTYKGVTIIMQGGLIDQEGNVRLYQPGSAVGKDGNTYWTYGAESPNSYSGFAMLTSPDDANFSTTGFTVRKFLSEDKTTLGRDRASYTPWIDFRLAEIYLNYAEAVVESGKGDQAAAAGYLNALRKRAGHTDNIPLTLDNVMKERRIELAFEGQRIYDMYRRREYHTLFTNYRRHALVCMVDLREQTPKYVFLRIGQFHENAAGGRTFQTNSYYLNIPGLDVNGLVGNPGQGQ